MDQRARISGWGAAFPERVVTSAELERHLGLDDGWIAQRTGIRERRFAGCGESTATLATAAARAALARADVEAGELDLIAVATTTPEQPIPHTGAFVAGCLGTRCGSFDVNGACTGFVSALVTASSLTSIRRAHTLVIGAETFSRILDPFDRSTAVVFGDAAGAVVVSPSDTDSGPVAWDLGCDPTQRKLVELTAGGSRQPTDIEALSSKADRLTMSGRAVFDFAVPALVKSCSRVLDRAGLDVDEVTHFVPHQANIRILEAVGDQLGIDQTRVVTNVGRCGNTAAASVPLALAGAAESFVPGDLVLLTAVGAGMTWGSMAWRW